MKVINFSIQFILLLGLLLACKPTHPSSCLSVGSNALKPVEAQEFIQGGYIQFGDSACSATFDILDVSADVIKLRAYSARHCRSENVDSPQVGIHLFFAQNSRHSGGYIKNIKVHEEFSERTSALMAELHKLDLPEIILTLFKDAVKVPTHARYDDLKISVPNPVDKEKLICLNENVVPRLSVRAAAESDLCWSAMDVGQYDLELRKVDVLPNTFKYLSLRLSEKMNLTKDFLKKDQTLAVFAQDQRRDFSHAQSELRFHKAARLAYLLSFDHCKIAQSESGLSSHLCKVQSNLIDLAGKFLVEADSNSTKVNIFDRIARETKFEVPGIPLTELKAGRRISADKTPATFALADEKSRIYAVNMYSAFQDSAAALLKNLVDRVKRNSVDSDKSSLSSAFVVSSNVKLSSGSAPSTMAFSQVYLKDLSSQPQTIQIALDWSTLGAMNQTIHGITQYGALRIGIPVSDQRLTFGPTDSGALITFKGVVPLMTLNTVDDAGVSGGASILALPEAQAEDIPAAAGKTAGQNPSGNGTNNRKNKPVITAACPM